MEIPGNLLPSSVPQYGKQPQGQQAAAAVKCAVCSSLAACAHQLAKTTAPQAPSPPIPPYPDPNVEGLILCAELDLAIQNGNTADETALFAQLQAIVPQMTNQDASGTCQALIADYQAGPADFHVAWMQMMTQPSSSVWSLLQSLVGNPTSLTPAGSLNIMLFMADATTYDMEGNLNFDRSFWDFNQGPMGAGPMSSAFPAFVLAALYQSNLNPDGSLNVSQFNASFSFFSSLLSNQTAISSVTTPNLYSALQSLGAPGNPPTGLYAQLVAANYNLPQVLAGNKEPNIANVLANMDGSFGLMASYLQSF